jgi:hypothetical protein
LGPKRTEERYEALMRRSLGRNANEEVFEQNLAGLRETGIIVVEEDIPDAEGTAVIVLKFSDGTRLKAWYGA